MAPEQIRGRRGDARTDVYALGMMLYEMLTAHLPFDSPNARALMRAKTNEEPRPPSYYVPGFDPPLRGHHPAGRSSAIRGNRYAGRGRDARRTCAIPRRCPARPQTGERRRRRRAARLRRAAWSGGGGGRRDGRRSCALV